MRHVLSLYVSIICLLFPVIAIAQDLDSYTSEEQHEEVTDFHMHLGVQLKTTFGEKWQLSLLEEVRLKDHVRKFNRLDTKLTLTHKTVSWFHPMVQYWLISAPQSRTFADGDGKSHTDKWIDYRHRLLVGGTFRYKYPGLFQLSLRELFETTFLTKSLDSRAAVNPELTLKSRFTLEMEEKARTKPYLYVELIHALNPPDLVGDLYLARIRLALGFKIRMFTANTLDVFYRAEMFERKFAKINDQKQTILHGEKTEYNNLLSITYGIAI